MLPKCETKEKHKGKILWVFVYFKGTSSRAECSNIKKKHVLWTLYYQWWFKVDIKTQGLNKLERYTFPIISSILWSETPFDFGLKYLVKIFFCCNVNKHDLCTDHLNRYIITSKMFY